MVPSVPTYNLYGDPRTNEPGFWLHCETIPARSSLHRWEIDLHRHESFFQILYISAGTGDAVFADNTVPIRPMSVVTVPASVSHGFRFSKDIDGYVFTILASHLPVAPVDHGRPGTFFSRPRVINLDTEDADARYAADTLARLGREWLSRRTGRTNLTAAYLTTALTLIARLSGKGGEGTGGNSGENERRIERLSALVHQHLREQKPAGFYAMKLGISPAHLNRIVQTVTGQSVHAFISRKLTDEARRDLVFTADSVQDIAFRLGFTDPAYFSRFFLRQTGMPPKAWRKAEWAKLAKAQPPHQHA